MRSKFLNISHLAIMMSILLACTSSAPAQDTEALLGQLCGKTDAPARNAAQLSQAYQKALDHLLPLMGADNVESRYQPQIMLQDMGSHASRPGAEMERQALAKVMLSTLEQATMPDTVRHWFVLQLQRMGQAESVPALAKLLASEDKHLRDFARRALEMNPDPQATGALELALASAKESTWKIGLISALGTRGNQDTVKKISPALKDPDPQVALATVSALTRISGVQSAKALTGLLRVRGTAYPLQLKAAQALIDMAQTQVQHKDLRSATWAFDSVFQWASQMAKDASSPNPFGLRVAAINGLMECSPGMDAERIGSIMQDDDPKVRAAAVQAARRTLTKAPMRVLSGMLPELDAQAQQQVLGLICDRGDLSSVQPVLGMLETDNEAVRLMAIKALTALGSDRSATALFPVAVEGEGKCKKAAQQGLARMTGAGVEEVIQTQAASGDAQARVIAIGLLGERHTAGAFASLLAYAEEDTESVSVAAFKAMADVVEAPDIAAVAKLLARTKSKQARKSAVAALKTALAWAADKNGAAQIVIDQMARSDRDAKLSMLTVLNAQGGKTALRAVNQACASTDEALQDAGIRTLSNWPDYEAVVSLLEISTNADRSVTHSVLALRGALRLIKICDTAPMDSRVKQALYALDNARRADDKKLAVAALGSLPDAKVEKRLLELAQGNEMSVEAGLAAVECARNMQGIDKRAAQNLARKIRALNISGQINRGAAKVLDE
jgi:HEAT repeat protein